MRKFLIIFLLMLLLTGCGKKEIYGEVISVSINGPYVKLLVRTPEDRQIRLLADGHTHVYSFSDGEYFKGLLSGKLIRPVITAYDLKKQDGAWLAERICVESHQLPTGYTLSDGTVLTMRRDYTHTSYLAPDGTEILREQEPIGPDNVYVGTAPSFDTLNPDAQKAILSYYKETGLLYDLNSELESAYRQYQQTGSKEPFDSALLSQEIVPTAANETLLWYSIYVTYPIGNGLHQQTGLHTVFSRDSGAVVDPADLFSEGKEAVIRTILDASGMPDTQLRQEMESAFRFEYLQFYPDGLEVRFPAGSLITQTNDHFLSAGYEDLDSIIYPWAIPESYE